MKFGRFTIGSDSDIKTGVLSGEKVREIEGNLFGEWEYAEKEYNVHEVTWKVPCEPHYVIGIGANFVAHKEELPDSLPEIPVFFYKPTSSVIGTDESIVIPKSIEEVKFESELAAVIGRRTRYVSEEDALDCVFGYTIGNDVTAPQFFHEDGHWTIGKSFDTFTPLGPLIETDLPLESIHIQSFLNGEKKQDSPLSLMILSVKKMISYLSNVMTLQPGDVILTGSPVGAGFLKAGDEIECRINGIGSLRNVAVAEK